MRERTGVTIIGVGPAGLLLGHMLHRGGVPFTILEHRSKEYVLGRIRAGVLEQGSVDILAELGLDSGLRAKGLPHDTVCLQFDGERRHVDLKGISGQSMTTYGQQAVVSDLINEHERIGSRIVWEAEDADPVGLAGSNPFVAYRLHGELHEIACDMVVGADGYHGVCRTRIAELDCYTSSPQGLAALVEQYVGLPL